jgi:DNA-binding LytR/AlgR family response regulator
MNILIIEDEIPARAKLVQMLKILQPDVQIVGELGSVRESIEWLRANVVPDLAFVDIQLSDDHSFEIFRRCNVNFPVIFTTAYDKYLLESFEFNSIDYLLKPISEEKLSRSLQKIQKLKTHFSHDRIKNLETSGASNSQRIIVRKGTDFIALNQEDVAYFYTEHKITFAKDRSGRLLIVDRTLTDLEDLLDKKVFFRLNRKYFVHVSAIEKFKSDNGKVLINLLPPASDAVYVSKEMAPVFRKWIQG